ncbi:hypothetical protein [Allomesorhizobium camelthorni]|uniref:SIR2-like domain-containing protein n=1 Tax=Allomesorhizobium camelthorni TaxID=475069 RepID=A0A6G4WGH6_9HYPH|nr:hypothetical protein [Mesorhizobium camelthorni]NGO53861.1 hypothetical protein [Mesorhizobium camelthorni]
MASQIAQELTVELARTEDAPAAAVHDPQSALTWLDDRDYLKGIDSLLPGFKVNTPDWGRLYGFLFERFFRSASKQRAIIKRAIDSGDGRVNWAHICLGELVRRHYAHTILTTNFDQLVLQGIILAGMIPVVADGLSALSRIASRPDYPQVVHLHGSMYTYELRNSLGDTTATQNELSMQGTMYGLKDADMLVVVGYSGSEEGGVVTLLERACHAFPNLMVYWILYDDSIDTLNWRIRQMLVGRNKFVILRQDADNFFTQLAQDLGFAAPTWVTDPLSVIDDRSKSIAHSENPLIENLISNYGLRLGLLRRAPEPSADNVIKEQATIDSLGGRDEKVVADVTRAMAEADPEAARLRAISLGRLGNIREKSDLLADSVHAWETFFKTGGADDGRARAKLAQTLLDLAESLDDNHDDAQSQKTFLSAMEAFRDVTNAVDPSRSQSDWTESALGFADSVIEQGSEGAAERELTAAIEILERSLPIIPRDTRSHQRALVQDRLGVLLSMRGHRNSNERDFRHAVAELDEAVTRAKSPESWAVGIRRHLAGALRGLGEVLLNARPDEAEDSYRRAAALYVEAASSYLAGLRDLDEHDARLAALWAYEEAEKLYRALSDQVNLDTVRVEVLRLQGTVTLSTKAEDATSSNSSRII